MKQHRASGNVGNKFLFFATPSKSQCKYLVNPQTKFKMNFSKYFSSFLSPLSVTDDTPQTRAINWRRGTDFQSFTECSKEMNVDFFHFLINVLRFLCPLWIWKHQKTVSPQQLTGGVSCAPSATGSTETVGKAQTVQRFVLCYYQLQNNDLQYLFL